MRPFVAFVLAPIPAVALLVGVKFFYPMIMSDRYSPLDYLSSAIFQLTTVFAAGLILSYLIIGMIAFPIYLFLRSKKIESALVTIAIAALLASLMAAPIVIDMMSMTEWGTKNPFPSGPCAGYTGVYFTICIFMEVLIDFAFLALCGAISGATFWLIYKKRDRHAPRRANTD